MVCKGYPTNYRNPPGSPGALPAPVRAVLDGLAPALWPEEVFIFVSKQGDGTALHNHPHALALPIEGAKRVLLFPGEQRSARADDINTWVQQRWGVGHSAREFFNAPGEEGARHPAILEHGAQRKDVLVDAEADWGREAAPGLYVPHWWFHQTLTLSPVAVTVALQGAEAVIAHFSETQLGPAHGSPPADAGTQGSSLLENRNSGLLRGGRFE